MIEPKTWEHSKRNAQRHKRTPRGSSAKPADLPADYQTWLHLMYPGAFTAPFAEHHHDFWRWLWALERGVRPDPYINIWARGGGKTTNLECAVVAVAAKGARRHALIVCETQDQADGVVSNIAARLESKRLERFYPGLTERRLNKYGSSKGWRRNRLTTASGLTVQGAGLDKSVRGLRTASFPDLPG